jgi:hypothetical protein
MTGTAALRAETVEVADDIEAYYELSMKEHWGDGAPLIPPTDERVQALLAATPLAPSHALGKLPPRYGTATVELAAINAAMAGCVPRAFPLVLAALEAIMRPEYNAFAITTTTSSAHPALIVNGPTRDELGIDYRAGCLGGAGGRGSMTVGRAVSLCLRNVGGQRVGENSRSVFGQPARFGLCFGEWEERSPWPSLAVRRGFGPGDEVMSVHTSKGNSTLADTNNDDAFDLAYMLGKSVAYPMSNWFLEPRAENGQALLLLNPLWAERLGKVFPKAEDFQAYAYENAWQPIDLWRPANQKILRDKERVDSRGRVYVCRRPDQIVPIVCGGLGNLHAVILATWAGTEMQSVAVTRPK